MKAKLAPYQQAGLVLPAPIPTGGSTVGQVLPGGVAAAVSKEKEYTALETSKIQAACRLTDAQWLAELPDVYPRMLEEGRTTARVKALLESTFQPDVIFSLSVGSAPPRYC